MWLITGINGYIGTHLAHRFRDAGQPVRGLVRQGRQEPQIDTLRSIGVEIHAGDPEAPETWRDAVEGVTHVAHLIGSIQPPRGSSPEAMHVGLSRLCVSAARAAGVRKAVFLSAINARPGGVSRYYDTKGRAEDVFRTSGIPFAIVRPALVCGQSVGHKHSKVMMKFVGMAREASAFKTVGDGTNLVQPLHVDDLAECMFHILSDDAHNDREFDLAGPERFSMNEMIRRIAERAGCPEKGVRHVPRLIARMAAFVAERVSSTPILTTDQLRTMREDMIADPETVAREFGFEPRPFDRALDDYFGKTEG